MSDTPHASEPRPSKIITIESPPKNVIGILRRLGPGLIIAGSIVGSGELIATTATGAQAGYWLLWLIILGCVIKVFVQVEFGRYAIVTGETAMAGMNETPGPTFEFAASGRAGAPRIRGNWLAWYWLAVFFVSLGQLGGIVGGVGQALAISMPLTEAGRQYNQTLDAKTALRVELHERKRQLDDLAAARAAQNSITAMEHEITSLQERITGYDADAMRLTQSAIDHTLWAAIVTVVTAIILVVGRYGLIQWFSVCMVAAFTFMTLVNLFMLQSQAAWAISWSDLVDGLSFRLPEKNPATGVYPLATALMTFGIIGVGANELISYPYWCLEKGYARFTGPRDDTPAWAERARGWLRVLRWDAWCSMIVYTFATIAFYLLGAAILSRINLVPQGTEMIRTLSMMYQPVFGAWTQTLFLFGAFAVLYSTFFVANAGHARVCSDAIRVFAGSGFDARRHRRRIQIFSGVFPFLCLAVYIAYPQPTTLVLASGAMQAMMLPMLSGAALYFRYFRCDQRLAPSFLWDVLLWLSALGMLVAGGWLALTIFFPQLKQWA